MVLQVGGGGLVYDIMSGRRVRTVQRKMWWS